MSLQWDNPEHALQKLKVAPRPHWGGYLGFYSSWFDGYFREPWAMLLPVDDHGFHRGDAVFEAARLVSGAYFDLHAHLLRLQNSAATIGMELPKSIDEITAICVRLASLCQVSDGILRLYVTRGPGGFSPSPREVVGHQIYAAITQLRLPDPRLYQAGASCMLSSIPAKEPFWSQIKSCNYLQNVLMKKECLERGFDFAVSLDGDGRLCEGSTENMFLISAEGEFLVPKFDYTLRGTTVRVVMKLAEKLVARGVLKSVRLADVGREDLFAAREAGFIGTTLGVLPVTRVDTLSLGGGQVGPIARELHEALQVEMRNNQTLRTVFESVRGGEPHGTSERDSNAKPQTIADPSPYKGRRPKEE